MTFKIDKPALLPARGGINLQSPVEKLNLAVNMLARVGGDPLQSAVRLGELTDVGLLKRDEEGNLIVGDIGWNENTKIYRGEFSSTHPNRAYFQTKVPNSPTAIPLVPSGTNTVSALELYNSSNVSQSGVVQHILSPSGAGILLRRTGSAPAPTQLIISHDNGQSATFYNNGQLSLSGALIAGAPITCRVGSDGYASLVYGDAQPGYVGFYSPDGTRRAYIGYGSGSRTQWQAENGWGIVISSATIDLNGHTNVVGNVVANGEIRSTGVSAALYSYDRTTGRTWAWYGTSDIFRLFNQGADVVTINSAGAMTALSFTPTSDRRAKILREAFQPREDLADQLVLFDYNFAADGSPGRGPIAQDMLLYAPEYVRTQPNGYYGVDFTGFTLEALAGLAARVQRLENAA